MKRSIIAGAFAALTLAVAPAHAVVGYADVVLDYFDSGAGPMPGPYGGTFPGSFPVPVSTSVVLGDDPGAVVDFLSLPTNSFVTVGFTDELVFNGAGNDILVREIGAGGETANVFVSNDRMNFVFLGLASGTTSFDLSSIGFLGNVLALRVVGLDVGGSSPGFDLVNVQALQGAFAAVPEPATWMLMIGGFGSVGAIVRRRRRQYRVV